MREHLKAPASGVVSTVLIAWQLCSRRREAIDCAFGHDQDKRDAAVLRASEAAG